MLASLSHRNMKRQLSEYKIFWFSLIGVVALMYAFNSLIVSRTMQQLFSLFAESGNGDIGVIATLFSAIVVFALGWFISYMMDFILQRRSREISTYMILGVEKSDICKMIFKENAFFGLVAIILGFGFGILVSKILESFVSNLFHFQETLLVFLSVKAVGLTCIEFCIVYIIALVKTNRKVQKVKLIDLLNYSRNNSSVREHQSKTGFIFLLISVVMLIVSFYSFAGTKQTVASITAGTVSAMLGLLCFFRGFIYIIHEMFNKSRNWKYKGSRLVTLRMFLSKSNKMSFSLGVISILFTCTIVCIGMTNAFYQVMEKAVVLQPFDLAIVHVGENGDYSQYSLFLNERTDVDDQYSYCLYTDKSTQFTDIRNRVLTEYWNRADKTVSINDYFIAENQYDAFMKYSDYCNLRAMLGLPQIPLSEEQYIIHCLPYLKDTFTNLQIEKGTLVCKDIFTEAFSQYGGYGNGQDFVIVVPDHYIENMEAMYSLYVVQSETVIDMSELESEFPQVRPLNSNVVASGENGYTTKILDKGNYYYTGKLASTPTSQAILIILPLCYLSLVIGIISIVILAVQLLTEVKTIKRQYDVMRTLGNEVVVLEKMLREHIFLYFVLPLIPALVIGSCLLKTMCHTLFVASYDVPVFDNLTALIALVVLSALLIFTLIYLLYVFITSQAMRKEIIPITLEK
ncbi:FtsX-like permease family protein [Mediterraneibacter gnavus]|uniref:ABC transporter permease n=1 Tax=Mediterraneibacter gnavus TaxID=33038 RepID=A0AAJ1B8V9_MEDGN|nr:ABC transporter permease [Mediterraneibacter gnavus]MCB5621060.1 ABC transporter permease [Mediterraneibacter gnavus]MCB5666345.1 ABC transporter permease [Mediterraneibacter gnavus]MCB5683389.1 ABC transporter permease [Mediterraneibacter gnavus]NSH70612.1 ABC transporter permease [Mediterraneibacter gnavus]NSH80885.1 ABC transporter permease [Mediterraneibacter gnavus]